MRTVVEKLAGDAVAKMFIHREILIFGVYGGNMSTGLPDETFRLGQHRLADTMATFVGDHGQTTNHPTSGLIGMVEIRVETACRHGAAVSKSQQMFAGLFAYRVQLCLLVAFESIDIASEIGCEDHAAVC